MGVDPFDYFGPTGDETVSNFKFGTLGDRCGYIPLGVGSRWGICGVSGSRRRGGTREFGQKPWTNPWTRLERVLE